VLVAAGLLALGGQAATSATTYYVRAGGSDAQRGTSIAHAWRTLDAVNRHRLRPGDSVLFKGGQVFTGQLRPPSSGTRSAPIRYGSYGSGRAILSNQSDTVFRLRDRSYVTLDGLELTSQGAKQQLVLSLGGSNVGITIRACVLRDTASFAINSANKTDAGWTIAGNTIERVDESGILFVGSDFTVADNAILSTGLAPADPAHGIYAKGPRARLLGNTIAHFEADGISIRYEDSVVEGNRISDGPAGVAFFQESSVGGTTRIAYNTLSRVKVGVYLDPAPLESFVIANNTIDTTSDDPALDLNRTRSLTVANNVVLQGGRYALAATAPVGAYEEHDNVWGPAGGESFLWNGTAASLVGYQQASGQGAADVVVDPPETGAATPPVSPGSAPTRGAAPRA
jgi:parallel beta helix pectate lyase-like protein